MAEAKIKKTVELEHHLVDLTFFDNAKATIVTFQSALGTVADLGREKRGNGEKFFLSLGFNVIAVKPKWRTFYRTPDIMEFLLTLAASDTLKRFPAVVTYGCSMGGYGAVAYAKVFDAAKVIAVSPFSTLSPEIAPWEDRWPDQATTLDWSGPLADAATEIGAAREALFIIDPLDWQDRRHVQRLTVARQTPGSITRCFGMPGGGHSILFPLIGLDLMTTLSIDFFRGVWRPETYYATARRRRKLESYYETMLGLDRVNRSPVFKAIVQNRMDAERRAGSLIPDFREQKLHRTFDDAPWALLQHNHRGDAGPASQTPA